MDYFRKLGIEPEMDAAGNLIARLEERIKHCLPS